MLLFKEQGVPEETQEKMKKQSILDGTNLGQRVSLDKQTVTSTYLAEYESKYSHL